jgi:Protein of unknown function (DUF3307)
MGVAEILIFQLIAHLGADYFFQTNKLVEVKNDLGFKSNFLVWHTLIVFSLSWLLSFQLHFFIAAGIIAITHYFIDGIKAKFIKNPLIGRYIFFIDQILHIAIILFVVILFNKYHGFQLYWEPTISLKHLTIFTTYLLCLKPANILIKEIFRTAQLEIISTNELPNAGKLIGNLERLLTLTFIWIGQFEAVGFLIAAKSVLRYRDDETLKTEYVLIGTMLSFGIAVVLGIFASII